MRTLNVAMVCLTLMACAVDEQQGPSEDGAQVAQKQEALSSTPPTSLANYRWGTPLFPSTVRSAYVVITQHPTDQGRFLAFGFDLVSGREVFFVHGTRRGELTQLLQQIDGDIAIPSQYDSQFTMAAAQQLKKGPGQPPDPPGGSDWSAWHGYGLNIARKLEAAVNTAY